MFQEGNERQNDLRGFEFFFCVLIFVLRLKPCNKQTKQTTNIQANWKEVGQKKTIPLG